MTAALDSTRARARVDRIKTGVEVVWSLIVESYEARDWEALGYSSWDDLCTREFGTARLRLPREDRVETVQSLRSAGLSLRAIASATGDSHETVRQSLAPVKNLTPAPVVVDRTTGEVLDGVAVEELDETAEQIDGRLGPIGQEPPAHVTGIDGKTYTPQPKAHRSPPRKPLLEVAKTRGFALRQATDSLLHVFDDDRYRTNEKQVADALRGHLLYVAETVAAVLDQLP